MKKTFSILFAALFFLLCLIPSAGLLIAGPSEAAANEAPAAAPRLTTADGGFNTAFFTQLREYVGRGFFLRLEGITAWDRLAVDLFRTSGNDDVLLGEDGWLFYGAAADEISGASLMTDRQLWCAARSLYLMEEYAEGQGAKFLFVVPCGKYTVYPEMAPAFATVAEGTNRERLYALLGEMDVSSVDLYPAFAAAGDGLYWKWDSHWNGRGAALAADEILAALGRESDYFAGPFTETENHAGDLYAMLYPRDGKLETDYAWAPGFTFRHTGDFHGYDDMVITTERDGGEGSLLLFRDSSGRNLYPYLAESFQKAYIARMTAYRLDLIGEQGADTVIVELAERTLDYLLRYPAVYPAPAREQAVLEGSQRTACALSTAEGSMDGFLCVTGDLTDLPAADSPVFLTDGENIWEAIPGEAGFTAWLPAGTDISALQVFVRF